MNEFVSRVNNRKYSITFLNESKLILNDKEYDYSIQKLSANNYVLSLNYNLFLCTLVENKNSTFEIIINGLSHKVKSHSLISDNAEELLKAQIQSHSSVLVVNAPMPGLILKINKKDGDYVERGETVMILEAMKMENEIRAPISGKLTLNFMNAGTSVEKNTKLFEIK